MLIKAKSQLVDHKFKGEKEIFVHAQNVVPVMLEAKESRDNFNPNFTLDRPAWPVANVPTLIFKKFMHNGSIDWKEFDRWLNSDYGKAFKASR
jgi:hypothetical protein